MARALKRYRDAMIVKQIKASPPMTPPTMAPVLLFEPPLAEPESMVGDDDGDTISDLAAGLGEGVTGIGSPVGVAYRWTNSYADPQPIYEYVWLTDIVINAVEQNAADVPGPELIRI